MDGIGGLGNCLSVSSEFNLQPVTRTTESNEFLCVQCCLVVFNAVLTILVVFFIGVALVLFPTRSVLDGPSA